jgi:hypothetical protein
VRLNLEYCSTIWSPHTNKQKSEIEKVKLRAARYTTGRFHNEEAEFEVVSGCAEEFVSSDV